jgi:hypothetical protein
MPHQSVTATMSTLGMLTLNSPCSRMPALVACGLPMPATTRGGLYCTRLIHATGMKLGPAGRSTPISVMGIG